MANEKTFILGDKPGIRRDGTNIDSGQYNDGEWVRFCREVGRPRKIGGYRAIPATLDSPTRGSFTFSREGITYVMSFSDAPYMEQIAVDQNGTGAEVTRRQFNGQALRPRPDYSWQVDCMYDSAAGSQSSIILAHPGKNLINIDNSETSTVYWAPITDGSGGFPDFDAIFSGDDKISGGILCIPPFLVCYGSDGLVKWSNENEPRNFTTGSSGLARITGSKIVKGLPLRGGGQSPAALLWSLDSVYRMYYIGGSAIFKFDPVSSQSSVLSSSGIIEYDGTYYWVGTDRFLMYDGSVKELPCPSHLNYFFDNLNFQQRQKVWATKVTRFGEIWWHFPKGTSLECDHAIIYNIRLKCWYDTPISRSSGVSPHVFPKPIWFENLPDGTAKAWIHEEGWDRVDGEEVSAIHSFFETADFGFPTGGLNPDSPSGINNETYLTKVEPDFIMEGSMLLEVRGSEYAQSPEAVSEPFTFDKSTGKIDLREQRREIRLRFISNCQGGHYDAGKVIIHLDTGDDRS